MTLITINHLNFKQITANVSDNSKQPVLLWSDPPSDFPVKLSIGVTYISFVATDSSYNQAICEFSFSVVGMCLYVLYIYYILTTVMYL